MTGSVAKTEHTSRPWRVHELTTDFELEDVWAFGAPGGPHDFPAFLEIVRALGGPEGVGRDSRSARLLFAARRKLGRLFGLDRADRGVNTNVASLRERLPEDLRRTPVDGLESDGSPFTPLYVLDDEYAAELTNRLVHAVAHFGWVGGGDGAHHPRMAVLVRPNGIPGKAYMWLIGPFRRLVIYPALIKTVDRAWSGRFGVTNAADADRSARSGRR